MKTLATMFAVWLAATAVGGQTIGVHRSAQSMPLRVFDATGKLMAGTIGESDPAQPLAVTLVYSSLPTSTGDSFTLRIKPVPAEGHVEYRWAQLPNDVLYFESADCTGQAYVAAPGPMPGRRLALLDYETNLLYLSEPNPSVVPKTYQSRRYPLQPCDDIVSEFFLAVAINPVLDMDTAFTQPFEIR